MEQVPDAAGEVAFEAADGFAAGLAFGLAPREVGGGFGVQAVFGDGQAMQRAVEARSPDMSTRPWVPTRSLRARPASLSRH